MKTEGRTGPKSKGGSLAVGTPGWVPTFKEAVPPPPGRVRQWAVQGERWPLTSKIDRATWPFIKFDM